MIDEKPLLEQVKDYLNQPLPEPKEWDKPKEVPKENRPPRVKTT